MNNTATLVAATVAACLSFAARADHVTVEDAARAALTEAMPLSDYDRTEYAGVVLKCGDTYRYTKPDSIGESAAFRVRVTMPKGCELAGIYHTHPKASTDDKFFSPLDVNIANRLGVPSFLGIVRTGELRVYRPRTSNTAGRRGRTSNEFLVIRGDSL